MNTFTNLEKKTDGFNVRTYRLDRMKAFMDMLGNPQEKYRTIHVAGSKGKGSTAAFIANALKKTGHKTGLYMSPHVTDFRERFTLSGEFIEDSILFETADYLSEKVKEFRFREELGYSTPTTFELYTAFAFLLFEKTGCEYAVIETGLGGRLDATNILHPVASVLTPVELEHTSILGDTIEKIAVEKSKIIKKNTPVFVSLQKKEALEVFRKEASDCGSEFHCLDEELREIKENTLFFENYTATLNLSMPGRVQLENAALALMVLRHLGLYIYKVTEKALEETRLPGRSEMIEWKRPLMVDGAHTVRSMENILKTFRDIYPGRKGLCIFGCAHDKDYRSMLNMILENFDKVIISRPGTFKKSNVELLFEYLEENRKPGVFTALKVEAKDALDCALSNTEENEPILVCGSFYLAGEIKEAL